MCGIAGVLYFSNKPVDKAVIRRMTDGMAHRGPDADGFYDGFELGLGHRRLSIIDLSTAANQPFADNSGRYTMVFNGEMYNYQEVRAKLPEYAFRTTGDTEVLIAAYAKWGADCLQHFRGMFAFAIWDHHEKEMFVARDRLGVKPFYYYLDGDKFLFASETRAILASGAVPRTADPAAVADFFSYQSVSFPHSMIKGIRQLEAGSWMRIKEGRTTTRVYWKVTGNPVDFDFSSRKKVQERIRELMLQSVKRRLVSDVPVGAFLSGGIDSSAVVGLMAEAGDDKPNTFNIYFNEKEFDESSYAEMVAAKFNTNHTRILLKPESFLDELQNALDALDTPSGDGVNTYVVSKVIRQKGMTVALSGVGGDELFAGYPYFSQYLQLRQKDWLWKLPGFIRDLATTGQPAGSRKQRMQQLLRQESCTIDRAYPVFRQIITPELMRQLTRDEAFTAQTSLETYLAAHKEELQRLPLLSQVSAAEYMGYTQHTLLKDTDQMSMAVSLEVREPFFDQDLVEFVLAVPDELKKPSYPKSLLVESLHPLLPDEIVHRKKQGFLFPWDTWLRNELRSFGDKHIRNMAQRSFIDAGQLLKYWERFLSGDKSIRWSELWLFIVLDHWLEKNGVSC